jgi:dihydrofolate synthase/folylpolyglutamate synthase
MESKMTEPVQAENLKTVLCAIDILKSRDIKFNALATAGAIRATVLPGRMTRLKNGTYLSVAHNPEAVREALRALNVMHPGKKITYVFTAMKDKDTKTIFREMAKAGNVTLVLTTVDNRRACDIKDLEHSAAGAGVDFLIEPIPEKAVALARRIGKGGVTVIGGSFYLVNKFA